MKLNRTCFCFSIALTTFASLSQAEDASPATLAEKAIETRYLAEKLAYEKLMAERTVKGSEANIQQATKALPQIKATVEKGELEKQALQDDLKKKTEIATAAKVKSAETGNDQDKAESQKAEQDRAAAELRLRQKENSLQGDVNQLKRTEDRITKSEADMAAAKEAVPLKDAAAKEARTAADDAKKNSVAAEKQLAAAQNSQSIARKIDVAINARLAQEKISLSPSIDDAAFLRRVTLDIAGVIPKYEDVVAFLNDSSPNKRSMAIDRLLAEAAFGRNFSQRFCAVTTENGTSTLNQARDYFADWLAESLNLNRRWDHVVTDLIAAEGRGFEQPGALFTVAYRMNEQPDPALLLGAAGDFFLGLQIQCVQCHDHPYHEWKHEEFWSMAAMFGRVRLKGESMNGRELEHLVTDDDVDPKEMVRMNGIKYADQLAGGKIEIPDPVNAGKFLRTVDAKFLDGKSPLLKQEKGNHRRAFAQWVTGKENPYFARATVNRLWSHFFGRGIVEPILNLHPDNAPSQPELLELLADEFKKSDYDLKHLIRCITNSDAYQRSSKAVAGNENDESMFSHMAVKPLDSYVMIESLCVALQRTPPNGSRRREDAAVFDTRLPGGDPRKYTHSIPQVLKLMNTKDHAEANKTVQSVTNGKPPADAVQNLFLAVLSRPPTKVETEEFVQYVAESSNPRQGYADVFWVLLNSAEFLVNH